jgi:hypothetical protein
MRKIVVVYGLIAGGIITILMLVAIYLWSKGTIDFDNSEYFGYGSMLVSMSMIFFGIKSFRDNQNGKKIGFWKGIQIGLLISLIASVIYTVGWETFLQVNPAVEASFMAEYTEHYIGKLKEKGVPQKEIDQVSADMASMSEMYKNPLLRFGFTLIEILPVGIIVTLLSAAILRRKEVLAE